MQELEAMGPVAVPLPTGVAEARSAAACLRCGDIA